MNEYFIQTLSVITFLAMADLLVTKSSNGKLVKTVISLISVTTLAIPIVSIIKNVDFSSDNFNYNENYNEYLLNLEEEVYIKRIKKALYDAEISDFELSIEFSGGENPFLLNKITVIFINGVINSKSEHIDMTERVNLALKNVINLSGVTVEIETKG